MCDGRGALLSDRPPVFVNPIVSPLHRCQLTSSSPQVNVGRAGAANLDVIQEVEYVKEDAKLQYLLECLQKTAPPVLVFAENKADVDLVHEFLLVKVRCGSTTGKAGDPASSLRIHDTAIYCL